MSLTLKDHDAVHLAAVALGLNVDRVGLHKKLGQARIRVGVKWFLPRLAAIGIAPGPKTGREHAPRGLEHNRHFWRGVVDGDGWVRPEQRVIGLVTASPTLRDQFAEFLDTAIRCTPSLSVRSEGALYQMTLTGSNAATLASLLYAGLGAEQAKATHRSRLGSRGRSRRRMQPRTLELTLKSLRAGRPTAVDKPSIQEPQSLISGPDPRARCTKSTIPARRRSVAARGGTGRRRVRPRRRLRRGLRGCRP